MHIVQLSLYQLLVALYDPSRFALAGWGHKGAQQFCLKSWMTPAVRVLEAEKLMDEIGML